jgi:Xaa-Pro dipeptidase
MWFSREEFDQRLDRLVGHMVKRGVDVLVVDETEHLAYLIGYSPSAATYQACLVSREGDLLAVVRELDEPTFLAQSWVRDYVTFRDWDDPIALLARLIEERGWGRAKIGMELDSHFLLVQRYRAFSESLPNA